MEAIVQSEAAECGLACLAMIASHYGGDIGLRELRRRHSLSLKGATLSHLMEIAGNLNLKSRALRLELDQIDKLQVPCILHWDLNHFVVLTRVGRRRIHLADPAVGRRTMLREELSRHFTGVALELVPTEDFRQTRRPASVAISQLLGRVTGLRRAISLVLLLSISLQVFVLLAPFFMQWLVDNVLIAADRDLLAVLCIGFGLALLLQIGIGHIRGRAVVYLSSRLGMQWTGNVFAHLIKLPLEFYQKRHLGDITSRMGSVQTIQRTLTTSFVEALIDGLMAFAVVVMMLMYSWKLATISLTAVVLYVTIRAFAFSALRARTERQLIAAALQQSHLLESIRGVQSIKVAGGEALRLSEHRNLMNESTNHDVRLSHFGLTFSSISQFIFGLERIAVIWIGAALTIQSVFSVGMLIAYLAYKDQFSARISGLIDKWIEFRMLRLHGERLADIVFTDCEQPTAFPGAEPDDFPKLLRLEADGLGYRYSPSEPWIIRNCTFTIEAGESVAIVGASGCGKSTMMKLLLGLLAPTEGEIRIGGVPLHRIGLDQYRRIIGAVLQDDQLFAGSIGDNIAFNQTVLDESRVRQAALAAAVHDDVIALPMGYSSLVGDMGTMLSGGQKQRIILARALYREPKLLFLDEATSHLDLEHERLVNSAVRALELTRVIIAHRPETIASADRVFLMEGGSITERALADISGKSSVVDIHTERL